MALFKFGSKNKLGIDIGTASIKIVELSKESGRFKLENYGLFELKSDNINTGDQGVTDQDLIWGIKQTLDLGKFKTRDAVVSIPLFNTFATVITMPFLSEQDIAKTIPYEARKYIPLPLSEVVLDWSIINVVQQNPGQTAQASQGTAPKGTSVEVFIVAVPKDQIEHYQTITKQIGLNTKALELENTAMIRAIVGNDLSPVAIINIGGRSTSILVVDNGFERVSLNYEVGGFEITKSIARSLNVSLKRAEELKRSMGLRNANSDMITSAMSSLVDLIAFEAKKTIHNYEDLKKTKIANILLVGGLANMPMFIEYFADKLGLPISSGNPLARVVYPSQLEPLKMELNSTFAIALGLAMREV